MFKKILLLDLLFLLILISPAGYAQLIIVNGYIYNSLSGEEIKNVNVFEKNSKTGTITNKDGYFKLVLQAGEADLSFSDHAYFTQITKLNLISDTILNVELNLLKQPKKQQYGQLNNLDKQTAFNGFLKGLRKKESPN